MIKYALMRYVNPNIKTGLAQIEVLCTTKNITYWKPSNDDRHAWLLKDTPEEFKPNREDNTFTYGVQVK